MTSPAMTATVASPAKVIRSWPPRLAPLGCEEVKAARRAARAGQGPVSIRIGNDDDNCSSKQAPPAVTKVMQRKWTARKQEPSIGLRSESDWERKKECTWEQLQAPEMSTKRRYRHHCRSSSLYPHRRRRCRRSVLGRHDGGHVRPGVCFGASRRRNHRELCDRLRCRLSLAPRFRCAALGRASLLRPRLLRWHPVCAAAGATALRNSLLYNKLLMSWCL